MDPWDQVLDLLSRFVTPAWETLLQYIPLLLLFGLLPLAILGIAWMWRRNAALNRSRVPAPLPAGPVPDGVHLPPPSIWPFIAPIGLFLVFVALAIGGGESSFIHIPLALVGGVIAAAAALGWYRDANQEYDAIDAHGHSAPVAALTAGEPAELVIPEGVHLPGPSAWPFLAPIGLVFMFLGLVLGPLLLIGGLCMGAAAAIGWYRDANRELADVETGGHGYIERDPVRVFPGWAAPLFGAIGVAAVLLTLAPWLLTFIPEQTAEEGGPPVTMTPYLSATAATHFDQGRIVIPADTPVTLTFENLQAGVPHDVAIEDPADAGVFLFQGEQITGPATIDYQLPPLAAGEYPFVCTIHPPMVGTVLVREGPPPPPAP
ncbi:MAG: cupredoxin domain-containing protein [Chloroflexi bacterium]|nr:cupredoxin domain-containing protein [Chloroflexota bacterium]